MNQAVRSIGWIEGFLFEGIDAERTFHETGSFEYVNKGGYYHSLPGDPLREFIDTTAEVQRAMGFENEKDHPEVAPSQFEINYSYGEVVAAADQIQLYKLICRQVATQMGNSGQASEDTRRLAEMIWDNAVGPVREVHIWTDRPSNGLFNEYWPQGVDRPKDTPPVPPTQQERYQGQPTPVDEDPSRSTPSAGASRGAPSASA